jgi:hypothetical protein
MNSGLIAACAAIAGSFVGALGSVVGTWITQKHQDRRDLVAKTIIRREALYSDFIVESARMLIDAWNTISVIHRNSSLLTLC